MTITHPIGYPTGNPMHNPKGYPNRGRIARPVSYRPVSSPSYLVETPSISSRYVTRPPVDNSIVTPSPVTPPDDMDGATAIHLDDLPSLDAEVMCDQPDSPPHSADLIYALVCGCDGPAGACWECWDRDQITLRSMLPLRCWGCWRRASTVDDATRIVRVLRPRGGA